jgi:DNA-binding FadR family transcriptional regulator
MSRAAPAAVGSTARNAHGRTLDSLGEAIVAGRYAPGSAVPPEAMLGVEFGVSRTVVREAIKSLVAKGLVSTGPKVGTKVLPTERWNAFDPDVIAWHCRTGLTRDFLRDLQELRVLVEPAAARLAAVRASPQDVEALQAAYAGMQDAIERGGDYVAHDLAFHQSLLRAGGNRMLLQMGKALSALLRTSFELSSARADALALSLPKHKAVLDAILARSPLRAERAVRKLIESAQRDIEHVLTTRRKLPSLKLPAARLKVPKSR